MADVAHNDGEDLGADGGCRCGRLVGLECKSMAEAVLSMRQAL